MAQKLRAAVVLQRTQVPSVAPTWKVTAIPNSSSRKSNAFLCLLRGTRHICTQGTYMHEGKTFIHRKKIPNHAIQTKKS